jgi:putative SOS response-associated peptidase YedK
MCNHYSAFTTQATMRKTFGVARDNAGNLPPLPGIFPDQMAPIVRLADGERELLLCGGASPLPRRSALIPLRTCATCPRGSGARGTNLTIKVQWDRLPITISQPKPSEIVRFSKLLQ